MAANDITASPSIAITGFGEAHWNARIVGDWLDYFVDKLGEGATLFFDFRMLLRDPEKAEIVSPGVDGTDQTTILAIYGEPKFPDVMIQCTKDIKNQYPDLRLIIGKCRSGFHRNDTSCRTMECVTNNLRHEDGPMNAKYFPTINCRGRRDIDNQMRAFEDWLEKP